METASVSQVLMPRRRGSLFEGTDEAKSGRESDTAVGASLERGDTVKLSSFGSFGIRDKGQRIGRNPKTGQEVPITPRRVLVFRASNIMKQRINDALSRRKAAE